MHVSPGIRPHPALRYLTLAIAWLLLWRVSALMQYAPHASIWFPPAGLSFAALLILGWRALPVLMSCAVIVTFWVDAMYGSRAPLHELAVSGLLFGAAHCLSYGIGAAVLKRFIRSSASYSLPLIIIAFLISGSLSALLAALTGIKALEVSGMLGAAATPSLWLPWWIGDMAGVLVLAPLFIGLLSWRYPDIGAWLGGLTFESPRQGRGPYIAKVAVSVSLLSTVMLTAWHVGHAEISFAVFFLIIPQMWIVYTESPFRSALSLAVFSTALALWVAALGLVGQALVYQFAICVIAASAYFGFAVPALIARNRQLTELALSDALTKALTKAHFFERAEHELATARRRRRPVSLIVLDIDRFKEINDTYGHAVGDQALTKLGLALKMQLRQPDLLGRFGGDEFMVLLPGAALERAYETAGRLQQRLHRTEVPGTPLHLSASFGVVCIEGGETMMQAFQRADRLMLEAKRSTHLSAAAG